MMMSDLAAVMFSFHFRATLSRDPAFNVPPTSPRNARKIKHYNRGEYK